MRIAMRLDSRTKLLLCMATVKNDVKNELLELLYSILEEIDAGVGLDIILSRNLNSPFFSLNNIPA